MWKVYYTPETLDEALEILAKEGSRARIVAGATDLILELERGLRPGVDTLIDISRLAGLDAITLDEAGWIHLGPLVTHNDCAASELIVERAFTLARACWEVGAPQIRTRGTISGNLITASPANDSIPPLMALGARVTLRSLRGDRQVALDDFYRGVRRSVMEPDELLTDIAFPALNASDGSTFYKLALRRAQAISVVNAAVVLRMEGSLVRQAAITLGAVAPTIVHAAEAEAWLVGKPLTPETMAEAAELALNAARPIDDIRASAEYRRAMVRVSTLRCLRPIAAGEERKDYPSRRVLLESPDRSRVAQPVPATLVHHADSAIETTVNGVGYTFNGGTGKTLLRMLRENLGLTGTKEGCAEGECGACTVILDGQAVMACMVPAPRAHGASIRTVEGMALNGELHPVQAAFVEGGAVQCGYCTPGFVISAAMLLEEISHPTLEEIKTAVSGNLCRCTGYYKILTAIEKASAVVTRS